MTWRDEARPIIASVIAEIGTSDERQLRAALRKAYPWGPREYHPYKIWLDEIRVQLGKKTFPLIRKQAGKPAASMFPSQRGLFDESPDY